MAHVLALEGADIGSGDEQMERFGHEMRAAIDEDYKRATWGRRPEDLAEVAALTGQRWER